MIETPCNTDLTKLEDSAIPLGFMSLGSRMPRAIDRRLGYFGRSRYVFFYYEPRGEEVMWNDGLSYGFGSGGWVAFSDHIAPLADQYGVNVGQQSSQGDRVLVVDREQRKAYFAHRDNAVALVLQQHDIQPKRQ